MPAPIRVQIDGSTEGLDKALKASSKSIKVFGHEMGIEIPGKVGLAVDAVAAVAKVTVKAGKAAKDSAAEEKIFADTMSSLGLATGDWVEQTDAAIAASQKMAFTDTETRKAIASLATATGDTTAALDLLTVAQDVARLSGVDLETASDAVAKAAAGQDAQLRRLIPGLEKGATASDTIANAQKLAAGAADTYAASSQAMGEKVKIALGEAAEAAGEALGPALKDLGAALKPLLKQLLDLASKVLPPVLDLLSRFITIASKVVTVINKIVSAIGRLISKIRDLLSPLTDAVNKLGQLDFNPFNAVGTATQAVSVATRAGTTSNARGGVTINIYGDPAVIEARVVRALRGYQSRNGVGSVFNSGRS